MVVLPCLHLEKQLRYRLKGLELQKYYVENREIADGQMLTCTAAFPPMRTTQ